MERVRPVIGVLGGAVLILSSGAHSILGWQSLAAQLAAVEVAPDLAEGLRIGWHFGGAAMLAFGIIAVLSFVKQMRGRAVWLVPAQVIALAYLLFGVWALVVSGYDPFFLMFIVPAVMIGVAASTNA